MLVLFVLSGGSPELYGLAEGFKGLLLLKRRLFCAGQGAVRGALKVLWWLLAVPLWVPVRELFWVRA